MLNVNDLVEGVTKVRILELPRFVEQKVGDVGTFDLNTHHTILPLQVVFEDQTWYFKPSQLEIVEDEVVNESESNENVSKVNTNVPSQSEDLIIYKSRWNEIIENLSKPLNCMTDEELMVVQSVLKTNIPFNVVGDPIVVDIVIEKETQTHLDANFVGTSGNSSFYYRSDILKKWFYWGENFKWEELFQDYNNTEELLPVSFGEKK